ncbi:VTT domain-containing protein [Candidatus Woesearchaeota archaeon]|nr:MAG: hypothetical protein QS99_C0002G0008 [archaeon GW2011_AR4]MBS3129206.1 VTT domain-containing protein [Candidatus Woesearchaeota archaeon]HIH39035.1 DedA family protein [Candidatus Woesearchaeota archaeon]HIH48342.1 DedA family protein [Candidatus Woesearchaeota archaeon]HIJ04066.1 DedA family protein [Candidatus Woesearchaeota archaeon]
MFEVIVQFLHTIYDIEGVIKWGGVIIICAIIFAETGIFAGFFLPGDSLLITAGILAAAGLLNVWSLLFFVSLAAVIGDQTGYYIGHKMGKRLFRKEDSLLFKKKHLEKAKDFYDKHGPKTIVLARFIPLVRTFAPAVAGTASMDYKTFVTYNIVGGIVWVFATILGGFFLGSLIPDIDRYLYLVIGIIILVSFIPLIIEIIKIKNEQKH